MRNLLFWGTGLPVRATYKDGKILNNSRTMLKYIPAYEFNFVHNYQINIISLYAEHFQI